MSGRSVFCLQTFALAALVSFGVACSSDATVLVCPNAPAIAQEGPRLLGGADCDPLVPTQCGFPFPSNVWLDDDPIGPENDDPHDKVRVLDAAYSQTNDWLRTGMVVPYCPGACNPK